MIPVYELSSIFKEGDIRKVHVIIGNFLKYIILLKTEIDDIVKLN